MAERIGSDSFLRMISAQTLRVCREAKPVPTLHYAALRIRIMR